MEGIEAVSVWCHSCEGPGTAVVNRASGELECSICQSDCVERSGQNVEDFQTETIVDEGNSGQLVDQVIDRILGLGYVPERHTQRTTVQHHGRPVNVVVRQLGTVPILDPLTVPMAPSSSQATSHSIFGLLSSLNSSRGQAQVLPGGGIFFGDLQGSDDSQGQAQWENFLHYILMNENSRPGAPPATKDILEGLRRINITTETNVAELGECCITQDPFETGDVMISLPCGHNYKQEPIIHWLGMHNTCPVCRVEVRAEL